jgi:hypothetical protein
MLLRYSPEPAVVSLLLPSFFVGCAIWAVIFAVFMGDNISCCSYIFVMFAFALFIAAPFGFGCWLWLLREESIRKTRENNATTACPSQEEKRGQQ